MTANLLHLRLVRIAHGYSLEELAERAGVHYSYIARIEKGERLPGPRLRQALSEVLNKSEAELFRPASA